MKVHEITAVEDEWYTPDYAVFPITKYIKPNSIIWCPFDTDDSFYVKRLKLMGHTVVNTHISKGQDFFTTNPPDGVEYIISNPPFSLKVEVLDRLFKLKIPFAMLIGMAGLFEASRFELFYKNSDIELMLFDKRVKFLKTYKGKLQGQPPFPSCYVCSGILDKQIKFVKL